MSVRHGTTGRGRAAVVAFVLSVPALSGDVRALGAQEVTASASGVVVGPGPEARPVRRAVVTLRDLSSDFRLSAVSDDAGRFVVAGVRPGRYQVTASKPAYLTVAHGAPGPGRPGTPLAIAAGQQVTGLRFVLERGAVISGLLSDRTGAPAANLLVVAWRADIAGSGPGNVFLDPPPVNAPRARTDDRGMFRIYGLSGGEYVVMATPPRGTGNDSPVQRSAADITTTLGLLDRGGDARPSNVPAGRPVTMAPVFYPGTTVERDAARVKVSAGEEREGVDFAFDLVPAATVEASIVWPPGMARAPVAVTLLPGGSGGGRVRGVFNGADRVSIRGVAPGEYVLHATSGRAASAVWARESVFVNGADIAGLALMLQPAMTLAGQVMLDGQDPTPPDVTRARVVLTGDGFGYLTNDEQAARQATTTESAREQPFVIHGILPGRYSVSVTLPSGGAGWWLASATAGGRELLDMPLDFGTALGSIDDAVLTLTKRQTELTGRLQTPAGLPATDYSVIVFSADRAHWFPGARRTRAMRPASDGMFSVDQLPAGRYLVAAVTDIIDGEWQRASFLEQLAAFAVAVDVRAGETTRQDLQIAAGR